MGDSFAPPMEKQSKPKTRPNHTGIPAQMKQDFEHNSGLSFDDVRVHYNSDRPAMLHSAAYTQGAQVYIAPGKERFLPHELGHVVQQKTGLIKPSVTLGGVGINTDRKLELSADQIAAARGRWHGSSPVSAGGNDTAQAVQCGDFDGTTIGIEREFKYVSLYSWDFSKQKYLEISDPIVAEIHDGKTNQLLLTIASDSPRPESMYYYTLELATTPTERSDYIGLKKRREAISLLVKQLKKAKESGDTIISIKDFINGMDDAAANAKDIKYVTDTYESQTEGKSKKIFLNKNSYTFKSKSADEKHIPEHVFDQLFNDLKAEAAEDFLKFIYRIKPEAHGHASDFINIDSKNASEKTFASFFEETLTRTYTGDKFKKSKAAKNNGLTAKDAVEIVRNVFPDAISDQKDQAANNPKSYINAEQNADDAAKKEGGTDYDYKFIINNPDVYIHLSDLGGIDTYSHHVSIGMPMENMGDIEDFLKSHSGVWFTEGKYKMESKDGITELDQKLYNYIMCMIVFQTKLQLDGNKELSSGASKNKWGVIPRTPITSLLHNYEKGEMIKYAVKETPLPDDLKNINESGSNPSAANNTLKQKTEPVIIYIRGSNQPKPIPLSEYKKHLEYKQPKGKNKDIKTVYNNVKDMILKHGLVLVHTPVSANIQGKPSLVFEIRNPNWEWEPFVDYEKMNHTPMIFEIAQYVQERAENLANELTDPKLKEEVYHRSKTFSGKLIDNFIRYFGSKYYSYESSPDDLAAVKALLYEPPAQSQGQLDLSQLIKLMEDSENNYSEAFNTYFEKRGGDFRNKKLPANGFIGEITQGLSRLKK